MRERYFCNGRYEVLNPDSVGHVDEELLDTSNGKNEIEVGQRNLEANDLQYLKIVTVSV